MSLISPLSNYMNKQRQNCTKIPVAKTEGMLNISYYVVLLLCCSVIICVVLCIHRVYCTTATGC